MPIYLRSIRVLLSVELCVTLKTYLKGAPFKMRLVLVHYVVDELRLQHMSPKSVWGQCDKRMLVGALCPVS
jgi:hypothetical protein